MEKHGDGYFKRAVNNQWLTLAGLMIGRSSEGVLRAIPIHPVYSSIMVTQNCNYKCVMCSFWHRHTPNELETAEIQRVTRELRELGIAQVNFTGGEPLLRSDLAEIVRQTAKNGFVMIQVTTNASLADKERLTELLEAGVGRVAISCDGVGTNHETQRGVPGAWKKNIAALDALRELRSTRFPKLEIELAMVASRHSAGDLGKILALCEEYRAVVHLQFLDNVQYFTGDADYDGDKLAPPDIDGLIDEVHHHLQHSAGIDPLLTHEGVEYIRRYLKREDPSIDRPRVSCGVGYAMVYIDSLGNVYPGCFAVSPIGNVREAPLSKIVNSERHRTLARDMFNMNCPTCPNGYAWGVFTNPRAIVREAKERAVRRLRTLAG
ncbi:radical SAM/SPASM domain-containing protein [Pendulispora albinea]|uniref:Radical SAM protein n=1 Tax=Pendulispora albinea TaxID=2741071 RepID=A0ABZ2MBN4_9BACT